MKIIFEWCFPAEKNLYPSGIYMCQENQKKQNYERYPYTHGK